ncbi:NAD(P)H-dependent oxidoreductase [Algivirga pacifica]|uniref:NAD(P)H-dependent oxidoreductase n=1 Tax=Algivirga pacifica TaxID=1162670 RepID=A0ABP9D0A7_9BACT
MDIIEKLNWRYATKKFDTKKLPQETVEQIIEAGNLTASSYGLQPWKIVVVENPEVREQLVEYSWGQAQVKDASHLLVIARQADINADDVEAFIENIVATRGVPAEALSDYKNMMLSTISRLDESAKQVWMDKQAYIVLGNLLTVCAALNVDTCPMEGFVPAEYDRILGLVDKGLQSVLVLPIGYRAEDDTYQHLKKVRKPLEEAVVTI